MGLLLVKLLKRICSLFVQKCPPGLPDASIRTFIFKNQGHTLGNVVRDQLLK